MNIGSSSVIYFCRYVISKNSILHNINYSSYNNLVFLRYLYEL